MVTRGSVAERVRRQRARVRARRRSPSWTQPPLGLALQPVLALTRRLLGVGAASVCGLAAPSARSAVGSGVAGSAVGRRRRLGRRLGRRSRRGRRRRVGRGRRRLGRRGRRSAAGSARSPAARSVRHPAGCPPGGSRRSARRRRCFGRWPARRAAEIAALAGAGTRSIRALQHLDIVPDPGLQGGCRDVIARQDRRRRTPASTIVS